MDDKNLPNTEPRVGGSDSGDSPENDFEPVSAENSEVGDLVRRISSGDTEAQSELYSRFYRGLYFILLKNGADESLAEDIAQDTFEVVFRNILENKIKNPNAISSYIRKTGIFKLIVQKRTDGRRKTDYSSESIDRTADESASLFTRFSQYQMRELVRQLLEELPVERDREILRRFYLYDQDKKSICNDLDLSTENFDRVKFRALKRLKELIKTRFPDGSNDDNDGRPGGGVLCILMLSLTGVFAVYLSTVTARVMCFIHLHNSYLPIFMREEAVMLHYLNESMSR